MFIEWQEKFNTGVERMDAQHKQLIAMLNNLYDGIGADMPVANVWPLLDGFNRYADIHFDTEERLARDANVDHLFIERHIVEHESYRSRMRAFKNNLEKNDKYVAVQMMSFLSEWWVRHIQTSDQDLAKKILAREVVHHG